VEVELRGRGLLPPSRELQRDHLAVVAAGLESFRFALDWEVLLRFRDAGARFLRLPRLLGCFRVHAAQKTSSQMEDLDLVEMARLRERCHGRAVTDDEIRGHTRSYLCRHVVLHKLYRLGLIQA